MIKPLDNRWKHLSYMDYLLFLKLRVVSLSYQIDRLLDVYSRCPDRDATAPLPARCPNKRKLSDAFVRTVRPDPDRVIVYWDTLQHGLALAVQPSGHRAWKCVYTVPRRGPRWYSIGNAGSISLTEARRLAGKIMVQVAEGGDPHADRLALRGRGSFEQVASRYVDRARQQAEQELAASGRAGHQISAAAMGQAGYRQHQAGRRQGRASLPSQRPVLANQVLAAASAIFSWAVRQEIVSANPCSGVEKNNTTSRERVLSDAEIAAFWPHLSAPLKMILLTGQRPGEVAHLHRAPCGR